MSRTTALCLLLLITIYVFHWERLDAGDVGDLITISNRPCYTNTQVVLEHEPWEQRLILTVENLQYDVDITSDTIGDAPVPYDVTMQGLSGLIMTMDNGAFHEAKRCRISYTEQWEVGSPDPTVHHVSLSRTGSYEYVTPDAGPVLLNIRTACRYAWGVGGTGSATLSFAHLFNANIRVRFE